MIRNDLLPTVQRSTEDCHQHTWVVFSTAVADGWLMMQCVDCGFHGVVKDPSKKEWSKAFRSPSRPYCWTDESRIVVQPQVAKYKRYVVRKEECPKCECYDKRRIIEPLEFERFPNELTRPAIVISEADKTELIEFAELARNGKLCSLFLGAFIESFERDTGFVHGAAVKEVARRFSKIDSMGLHCSPLVVSRLLMDIASQDASTNGEV